MSMLDNERTSHGPTVSLLDDPEVDARTVVRRRGVLTSELRACRVWAPTDPLVELGADVLDFVRLVARYDRLARQSRAFSENIGDRATLRPGDVIERPARKFGDTVWSHSACIPVVLDIQE
ncbi:hypothetical protein O1W68_18785 [Rhodococcus sp. H36-A4]|uniref:hypothetical protein n=1 Tax=Rhodococcus sp. H36-A4 TaxID=3004353 RepID=UPI0022AF9A44|nr:hypothetical protein [Rhodococcus sp. H36-A4]MCZ4079997.1 hypothetical protein [Rhodococcus sp. H36-A4]